MSEIAGIIDAVENRIAKLFSKIDGLEGHIEKLNDELGAAREVILRQSKEMEQMKSSYETLKVANSLLGSDEGKRETKLKINTLIRDIDYCIAQLSD